MNAIDIRPLINEIAKCVQKHELKEKGAYCRWLWEEGDRGGSGAKRALGRNEYGCADAANILYTINDFYCDEETRRARIFHLRDMQDEKTGMYYESSHDPIHTTAHCLAALQLFDEKPLYKVTGLHKYYNKNELYALLEGLDWKTTPWQQSHLGAGVYAALVNADEITKEFSDHYFSWLYENADEVHGFWKKGFSDLAPCSKQRVLEGKASLFNCMAGGFHFIFNHEYANVPLRYPERIIDSCIKMYTENGLPNAFAEKCNFIEVDWLYCMTRAGRQTPHRYEERQKLVADFAQRLCSNMLALNHETDESFNDLHMLFGTCCALAELQSALPGKIITEKPLRLVLDRRPFI